MNLITSAVLVFAFSTVQSDSNEYKHESTSNTSEQNQDSIMVERSETVNSTANKRTRRFVYPMLDKNHWIKKMVLPPGAWLYLSARLDVPWLT